MRPLSGAQIAELAQSSTFAGECLVLAARDGTRARFTSIDLPQVINLGFGAGDETCSDSMVLAAITLAAGLDASFAEVRGPLGPVLTRAALEGGKWTDADAWLVRVWPGIAGWAPVLKGKVREPRVEDPQFVLQIRNQGDNFNQALAQLVSGYCRFRFGSAECGGTPVTAAATVTAVTDAMNLAVSYAGSHPNGFFQFGEIAFTSGALNGVVSEALFNFTQTAPGAGTLVLDTPLPALPTPGDTLVLKQGCPKIRSACIERQGTAINFGGEPDVPGSEAIWQYPNVGGS